MRLADLLDVTRLGELIAGGLIAEIRHPAEPLRILDYTRRAQGRRAWEPTVEVCRGLIVADDDTIVARPFRRMPSVDELPSPPAGPFEATEKLDGSLVIHYGNGRFATRRSFVSAQARMAETFWLRRCSDVTVPRDQTWLFELIHPSNRNIVDYGKLRSLVLVGAVDVETGSDVGHTSWPGPVPRRWQVPSLDAVPETGGEGFVLRLEDGTRVKYKAGWYRRVEETINRTTELTIWDALRNGRSLDDLLTDAPPAFEAWVEDVAAQLRGAFHAIEQDSRAAVDRGAPKEARRPEIAYKIAAGSPSADRLWRLLRPRAPQRFQPKVDPAPKL